MVSVAREAYRGWKDVRESPVTTLCGRFDAARLVVDTFLGKLGTNVYQGTYITALF